MEMVYWEEISKSRRASINLRRSIAIKAIAKYELVGDSRKHTAVENSSFLPSFGSS